MLLVTEASFFYTDVAAVFPPPLLRYSISKITFLRLSKYRLLVGSMDFYRGRARGAAHVREGGGKPAHSDVFLKSLTGRTAQFKAARMSRQHAVLLNMHQK